MAEISYEEDRMGFKDALRITLTGHFNQNSNAKKNNQELKQFCEV